MRELGHRVGEGSIGEPVTEPNIATCVLPEAVQRADLRRSRQAESGTGVHPEAARFADRIARAVADLPTDPQFGPGGEPRPTPRPSPVPKALRDAVFGDGLLGESPSGSHRHGIAAAVRAGTVTLPNAPAVLYDRTGRIVRANDALIAIVGPNVDLVGMRLAQLAVGPDTGARMVRADGTNTRVRVVRWEVPGEDLTAAALIELDATVPERNDVVDRTWTAELERLARVGTWSYELSTGALQRSETLDELYRSVGFNPELEGEGPIEGKQVTILCAELREGRKNAEHLAELRLPGDKLLSCRAEVETAPDGTPVRLVGVVRDLTAHRHAEGRLRQAGRRFVDLMTLVPGGVMVFDAAGRLVDANPAMCAMLGTTLEALRGLAASVIAAPDAVAVTDQLPGEPALPEWLRPVPPGAKYGYKVGATSLTRVDGSQVWCDLDVSTTAAEAGTWYWLVACTDVSERNRAAELLRNAGTVDELTRLPNRAATVEQVDRLLAGPGRDRVAVVCGDLDDFQRVNSSLGHDAGDDLLVALAARLQRDLPVGCTAARLSGDEFVVICADHAEVGGPDQLARTVAELLRTTITVHGRPVQVTASVGLATPVPTGEVRAADLLRFAEVAMHDAKRRQSRGGIGMATDGIVNSATMALELEAELRDAIASGGLVLDYQPVVGPDGTVLSAEALVRWPHPERGLISPAEFLPVAQRSGLLRELDMWVLRAAAQEAAGWSVARADGAGADGDGAGRIPAVAVNLAGLLPGDPDFLAAVSGIVADTGLPWDRLVLELVETSLVVLPQNALSAMAELVGRGVRFAVDDFGTGYSSLARLKELPAQTVKVDRAFVTGIADDPADFAVARAVVDMARAMGRTTVAEGVESAEQFHVLRGIGVDAYQGWLFSRPLAPSALREVLAAGKLATPATRP
ncbi:putative bifunctional diguanylate cyclase/phosphodiesterase [Pseudonocardia sp. TRM90224]|uniref:putative bifunctional diguanylate cyclase/phosphodiesterase n=1 Tax=Pseudonocardia sp. TRM90224 TaxID=2812678 RepID=UPI001E34BEAF|nr:GGDEF domain-containing phosphodiesterase [Pseudonocardia sp. TRM90224]